MAAATPTAAPAVVLLLMMLLREGSQKNVKVWSLTKVGGGSAETKPLLQNLNSFILSVCPQTCPIRGEIICLAVLVL